MRRPPFVRAVPVLVLACTAVLSGAGCRSLLPQEDDSTVTTIGKVLIWVPVTAVVLVGDAWCEDEVGISPLDDFDPSDGDDWDDRELRRQEERYLLERDLRHDGP